MTRNRKSLREYIRSYTVVPSFDKISYEILAFTLSELAIYDKDQLKGRLERIKEW